MSISGIIMSVRGLEETKFLATLKATMDNKPVREYKMLKCDWNAVPAIVERQKMFNKRVPSGHVPVAIVEKGTKLLAVVYEKGTTEEKFTVFDFKVHSGTILPHLSFILHWGGYGSHNNRCEIMTEHGEFGLVGGRLRAMRDGTWSWIF